ncbi:MAG: molybdenum cofactor biosynthesis protein MoaB [Acidobacteria bacterium]|nr:molybdenum cofactor biosynthesis protein MoaB [Acidobacteriota bacterium]
MSQSTNEHREKAKSLGVIKLAIITVSDTRTPETDANAHWLRERFAAEGHELAAYRLIRDEPDQVEQVLEELVRSEARILLWNGGTGIAPRDTTYDVLSRKLEKTLPGFGEIFRMLSFEVVGGAAMLSRATAGVYKGKLVISTPGSPNAVELAWNRLIGPEIAHLAWEVVR